jgi:hypothetical protein
LLALFPPAIAIGAEALNNNDSQGRVGLYGNIGVASLTAGELNNRLQQHGNMNNPSQKINSSLMLDYALRWGLTDFLQLGMMGGLEVISGSFAYQNGDKITVNLQGVETGIEARFACPLGDRILFSVGTGMFLHVIERGDITFTTNEHELKVPYSGRSLAFRPSVNYDYFLWRNLALGLELGARVAQMTLVNEKPSPWGNIYLDADAIYASCGIRIYW